MDVKTIAASIISVVGSLLAGFGVATADQVATFTSDATAIVGAVVGIVGLVGTWFFHKSAVTTAATTATSDTTTASK